MGTSTKRGGAWRIKSRHIHGQLSRPVPGRLNIRAVSQLHERQATRSSVAYRPGSGPGPGPGSGAGGRSGIALGLAATSSGIPRTLGMPQFCHKLIPPFLQRLSCGAEGEVPTGVNQNRYAVDRSFIP